MKYDLGVGMAIGLLWASSLWSYALGFWYGAKLIADQVLIDSIIDLQPKLSRCLHSWRCNDNIF